MPISTRYRWAELTVTSSYSHRTTRSIASTTSTRRNSICSYPVAGGNDRDLCDSKLASGRNRGRMAGSDSSYPLLPLILRCLVYWTTRCNHMQGLGGTGWSLSVQFLLHGCFCCLALTVRTPFYRLAIILLLEMDVA